MSRNEVNEWALYFQIEPHNSTEIQLALMAQLKAISMGNKDTSVNEFLITTHKEKQEEKEVFADDNSVKSIFSTLSISK